MTARAFDAVARQYDATFTSTPVGRELRQIVWRVLSDAFPPGTRVWELNCGTGEDAVWLAGRDIRVLASDGSPAMLELAALKAEAHSLSDKIDFLLYDFSDPAVRQPRAQFDGVLSNFGGLNCIADLRPLAAILAQSLKPGGRLVMVIMGKWCAWEIIWHLIHLQPGRAFRRLRRTASESRVGGQTVRVWYPANKTLKRAFSPEFRIRRTVGLGVFLPPTYLQPVIAGRGRWFRLLRRLEHSRVSNTFLRSLGDHILYDFERTSQADREPE